MRFATKGIVLAALLAAPAYAQHSPSDAESADTLRPKTLTIPGASQMYGRGFAAQMILARREQDYCWEYGCLVLVNETDAWDITGFYVQIMDRSGRPKWSANQFGEPLYPMKATFRFKTGTDDTCDRPVLFVLKHKDSKETARIETHASLCKSPQMDSLVRIKVRIPTVIVVD
jgi:hypothetical protein